MEQQVGTGVRRMTVNQVDMGNAGREEVNVCYSSVSTRYTFLYYVLSTV